MIDPEIKDAVVHLDEYDNHEIVKKIFDVDTGLVGFITIHRTKGKPAFGATRLSRYLTEEDALKEALRLSKLMTYKAALVGIPFRGAKAVLIENRIKFGRRIDALKKYAEFVNDLKGKFITGTDVGLDLHDIEIMSSKSDYFVGFRSDPEKFTALGVFNAIEGYCEESFFDNEMKKIKVAIQGIGKVGFQLLKILYPKVKQLFIADINSERLIAIQKAFPSTIIVPTNEIHKCKVDIFSPNALSNAITESNVNELNCKAIIGGANSQLESQHIADLLFRNGITYIPDYLVNAGGLISVVNEYSSKSYNNGHVLSEIKKIKRNTKKILRISNKKNISPLYITNSIAESMI